ncbi:MAG: 23S rRNA (adenine(2503)-C(2))-methyltransferase RlmN [Oscillospiraceae bacterium]
MQTDKIDIKSLLPEELAAALVAIGEPKYRAAQVYRWLSQGAESFAEMTNLSMSLRDKLAAAFYLEPPTPLRKQVSAEDGTIKYLWQLRDGNAVETVVMRYKYGNTVCISTQVGCRQGCAFCASTIGGLERCLEPSEMLDEVMFSQKDSGLPISNIVLMGIGEPLDNFDNVIKFLRLVNSSDGMNIGMRHISLSTCGITEKFDKLSALNLQLTLSVSLHAPDDETRSRLMPANRGRGVEELMCACERYFAATGRRISFEYAMIDGVNDSIAQARLLAAHAKRVSAHVNLIPLNHVEESKFLPTPPKRLKEFEDILIGEGINVTVRRKLGGDIDASCGQLRKKTAEGR